MSTFRKIFFKILIILLCLIIGFLGLFVLNSSIDSINLKTQIDNFKNRSIYLGYSTKYNFNIYQVFDEKDITPSFNNNQRLSVGNSGDVLIGIDNTVFEGTFSKIVSFMVGGHAGIVDNEYTLETTGAYEDSKFNVVTKMKNNWLYQYDSFLAYKVKQNFKGREEAVKFANENIGAPYNFNFFKSKSDSFYCSDFVSSAYLSVTPKIRLNKDYFFTTVIDLTQSKNVNLFFYKEKNKFDLTERSKEKPCDYNIYYLYDGVNYFDDLKIE